MRYIINLSMIVTIIDVRETQFMITLCGDYSISIYMGDRSRTSTQYAKGFEVVTSSILINRLVKRRADT